MITYVALTTASDMNCRHAGEPVVSIAYVPVTLMPPDDIPQEDLNWATAAEVAAIKAGRLDEGNAVRYRVRCGS